MAASRNPYTAMLLTYHPSSVFGWENEIISMLQVITAPEPNGHALYGLPAVGKTTLLKFLKDKNGAIRRYEEFLQSEYQPGGGRQLLFVYLNFHRYSDEDSLFHMMRDALEEELHQQHIEIDPSFTNDSLERGVLVMQLRAYLAALKNAGYRVVYLLDDFDVPLVKYIDDDDDRLLRTLCDDAALIIATEVPISELRPDLGASSPLLGILRPEAIGLISEQAARQLIREPAQRSGVQFTPEEETFLIGVAGRHPFLLTTACEIYYDMRIEYPELSRLLQKTDTRARLLTQFIYRLAGLPHVDHLLLRLWGRLDQEERRALHAMAQGFTNAIVGHVAARIINKGLAFWDLKSGAYRVFCQLFEGFVRQQYHLSEAPTEPAQEHTLTPPVNIPPIDRALLRYFLSNANKVLTFDELLDAVWEDSDKSKRALEAAVHRLRRSLGPGEQIKNIRGKGYKFVIEPISAP